MNRRRLLATLAALPAATQLRGQAAPKFHLRAGLVAYSYRKQLEAKTLTYEDVIRRIADWGLDGLDCTVYYFPDAPNTPNDFTASLRRTALKNGVQIYNAGVRVRLCQPTPELQQAEFESIKKWVDLTERIGASHMRVFGGAIPKGATEEQAIGWAAEVLKRGAEYAGSRGITLGVEDDGGLTTNAGPTVAIVKKVDSPWAGINADTGNFPKDGYAQFASTLPYVTSVHLKRDIADAEGKKSKADWTRLLTMLGSAGYKGYAGLEYEGTDAETALPALCAELRDTVRKLTMG